MTYLQMRSRGKGSKVVADGGEKNGVWRRKGEKDGVARMVCGRRGTRGRRGRMSVVQWGRRMLCGVQWGRRMLCGEARSKIPRVVQCMQRAERGNLLFIGVRVEGFWGCSVVRGVRGARVFGVRGEIEKRHRHNNFFF